MQTVSFRLKPGQDLKVALDRLAVRRKLEAACVVTCVGSLTPAAIRFANQPAPTVLDGQWEIVSLVGTLSIYGSHCHIAVSDGDGRTLGGHLMEGSRIYTTAEIVLGIVPGVRFLRELDPDTGYRELAIEPLSGPSAA